MNLDQKNLVRALRFGRGLLTCLAFVLALRFAAQPAPAQTPVVVSYTNTSPITNPSFYFGTATPYPSTINVPSSSGTLQKVTVTLNGLSADEPNDLEIAVAGPETNIVVDLMFNEGFGASATNLNLTFDDSASGPLPESSALLSGTYQPSGTDAGFNDNPNQTTNKLAGFNGNSWSGGAWSLFVFDTGGFNSSDPNTISNWSLTFTYINLTPIQFSNPQVTNKQFTATLSGPVGTPLVVQSSPDLKTWTPVITNDMVTSPIIFTDTNVFTNYLFYRAATNAP